jgi:hypothetical protein
MKRFYPHQETNVFTNNNWTLSDECVKIFQSNNFYIQHVRWDIERFRPSDVLNDASVDNDKDVPLTQISYSLPYEKSTADDISQVLPQEPCNNAAQANEVISTIPITTRPKRKVPLNENQENEVRTQPRRMKKK